mmetsp:Transcript_66418/g.130954  ORF Transcript_66418/g.130954 Transcript_66418/m.130954 type:complete len:497 (-) Transcript_66418:124-1614(-)|eukprot:CAMPEP_0172720830 /NCGR_PEP_ID=MMETSP1074-20121228/77760_1 /TAXON_ID=2916 /ORGANISM="Ceratium fusus, Strain PA161109" /LENGTH=496 /DNA_ID=CAMNT_0013546421 /DNA_START=53 /DNA_END=1543 /DNA_ORIENTATION=-
MRVLLQQQEQPYEPLVQETSLPDVEKAREVQNTFTVPQRKIANEREGFKQAILLKKTATLASGILALVLFVLLTKHQLADYSSAEPFRAVTGNLTVIGGTQEQESLLPAPQPKHPDSWQLTREKVAFCNIVAPLPRLASYRRWDLSPMWLRVCEKSVYVMHPAQGRNVCWVRMKAQCHRHLKAHFTWARYQTMAANFGSTPPRMYQPFDPVENPQVCDRPDAGGIRQWTHKERVTARRWFRTHVGVYVLGMFSDLGRWNMISKRLNKLQIYATHINGVDMRQHDSLRHAKAEGWVPNDFNFTRAQEVAYTPTHGMGSILGTLGCATAHFKAQSQILEDGMPLALVFEDDSWPSDDFVERLWSLVHVELPCDWEVLSLYSRCPFGSCVSQHLLRVQPDTNEPAWRCHQGVNWGMQAILYRTESLFRIQRSWKRVVFDESRPHCMDIDVALAAISDEVHYYAVPSVQDPGFVNESNHPSLRWGINHLSATSSTTSKAF